MDVALVTVGDELLSGDTINTNAAWLGRELSERGVDIQRTIALPDDESDIARVVNQYRAEYDAVVVTGGLGPTHDDRTMAGVAAAFGDDLIEHGAVRDWLAGKGYAAEDLAPETTHLPASAAMIRNPEGVAPGCVIENVYVLPGVPTEMKGMFPEIADRFSGAARYVETVRAAEPESALVDRLEGLEERFDVVVGSYPGEHVRVKIQSRDEAAAGEAASWLRDRVDGPTEE